MTHKIDGSVPLARPTELTSRPLASSRAGSAERGAPVAATESVRLTGEAEGLQALERELGAGPAGIDVARVNALRAAIADGSYRVDAQAVASRMLDLEHQLGG
ncbi:flagellar biosynthesis anti-sigma factor FlgM [Luteimonas composti]|uniref:Negative regulator of flagellin synthesis n=1 Tax=Luteimonas composti TaxID=398257 RepID=A0ABT6MND2_9GAMM|nr:flagellar biosynthesis anti-sigma factor FlgM [Luteimonas composti]MDH7452100.1 flagellar biosynthesis anti-sigma factor FlgM [Luteimonas composti]